MTEWDGLDRRKKYSPGFESDVISFMSRIDEHLRNQEAKCEAHLKTMESQNERITSLEASREYSHGVLKAMGVGIPAAGSLAYFVMQVGEALKKIKGGG